MAEIRLNGVNKVYPGGTHAVHDVDLEIADGEFMIMVGPSGCAKSTILRMIAGLEAPTTGTIEIGGRVVNDVAPKDRDIAMVFQSYALYPHMTVRENMAFGLRLRRMPAGDIDQRVAEAARILGLESLLDRLPKAMSGGQRQRVAMGRAIVREPQAFLMDEPLSNLDAKLRVQMRTEIAKLHQRLGRTTVYVTHDQVEALTLGQRICILRKGVIQQVDTPFQVYQNPANVFVGGFIGSPGMNFMDGRLVMHAGTPYLQLGEHHLPLPASVTSRLLATGDLHGRSVIAGVRPEHLSMAAPGDAAALPVQVELVEAMGAEVYAYFQAGVSTPDLTALSDTQASMDGFVARLGAGTEATSGSHIWLRPDLDEVHLFDPQTMLTMLAPVAEFDVRARQAGTAISTTLGNGDRMQVVTPLAPVVQQPTPDAAPLDPAFLRPASVTQGTLADFDTAAAASVFDQPVASPVGLTPMVAPATIAGTSHPRPNFVATVASESMFAEPVLPEPVIPEQVISEPDPETQIAAAAPAPPIPAEQVDVEPATATTGGFAPRHIGPAAVLPVQTREPAQEPVEHHVAVGAADGGDGATTMDAPTIDELDMAIDSIEAVLDVPSSTPRVDGTPVASTTFRETLARIRAQGSAPLPASVAGATILPPPVRLAEPSVEPLVESTERFRAPRL